MNMLDLMNKMTELSEAKSTNNAFTGNWKDPEDAKGKSIIHKGKYGTAYQGEPDDLSTDDTKKTKKVAPADGEKRGRGRPAKGSDSSGKTTSHDTQTLSNFMIGNKPSKAVDKLPKTKSKTLKDWFERLDTALNEDGQFTVKPAAPGASDIMGPDGKKVGTASTPAAAQAVKNGEVNFDKEQGMSEGSENQLDINQLASISDAALDAEYGYGRSSPGNTFGWQANLKSASYAKKMIDKGVTDIEVISDAIHKGWNVTAKAFVNNPEQFDDTEKLRAAGKLEAKLQQRQKLMNIDYGQLPDDEQEKDRVVARALLQALTDQQGMAEGDIGKHNNATTGFAALVKKLTPKYGVKGAMRIAGSQLKKIKEADMPPNDSLLSPMSEGGNPFLPIVNLVKGGTKVLPKPTGRPGMPPAQDARTDAVSQARNVKRNADDAMWAARQGAQPSAARTDAISQGRNAKRNADDEMWAARQGAQPSAARTDAVSQARNAKRNADDAMWAARQGTQPSAARTDAVSQARNAKRNADDAMWAARQGTKQPALESKKGAKPDFLDMDKDGDKKEPMKKAVADKKAGPKKGVNPFAKKKISEGKVKEIAIDLKEMTPAEFKKKYKMTKAEMEKNMNTDTNDNKKVVTEEIIGQPDFEHTGNAGRGSYGAAEYTATTKHRLGSHVYEVTTEQDGDGDFSYFIYENGKEIFSSIQPSNRNQLGHRISSALLDKHKKATAHLFDSDEDDDDYYEAKQGMMEGSLNELSSNTLSSYGKKAEKSNDKKLDKASGHSEKATNLYSKGTSSAVAKSFDHEDKANKLHNQVNKRNDSMDQAAGKLKKQMSKGMMEGVRHSDAAHLRGKAHAMGGENYNCRYTPGTNEANMYHMGFKEGLDECYGQMPMESYVEEEFTPEGEVENMPLMTDENYMMDESPFSWAAKNTPTGKHFTLAGHDFTKTAAESRSMNPFMESLDKQLNALLNDDINEGMTVSISKGQHGTPDSVSVSAQDSEAEQLLSIIKSAGLGLFGGENDSGDEHSSAMSMPGVSIADGGAELDSNINVVNDHDGMLDLIRKMTGQGPAQSDDNDYESEEHEHGHDEEECGDCGNNPCDCEAIDLEETPDQEEFMATEANAPDSGADNTNADVAGNAAANSAIAKSDQQNPTITTNEDEMEEDLNESYANSAENTFEADIEFMTNIITGGLNKQKSTGQSTIPVVASQKNRLGEPMQESTALLHDWKKLSGIT